MIASYLTEAPVTNVFGLHIFIPFQSPQCPSITVISF